MDFEEDNKKKRNGIIIKSVLIILFLSVMVILLVTGTLQKWLGKPVNQTAHSSETDSVFIESEAKGAETESTQIGLVETEEDPETYIEVQKQEQSVSVDFSSIKISDLENNERTYGIDVSKYQGVIDWKEVADSGVGFAMIRVGYRSKDTGEMKEDDCARYNLQEANANNIKTGAYFFSTAITEEEAKEEADFVVDLIDAYKITYPVAYNCEGFDDETSRQSTLSKSQRTNIAHAFLEEIENRGYQGMFYANANELANEAKWETSSLEKHYKIWVAQYKSVSDITQESPEYADSFAMWQYTAKGVVPGIKGAVDLDIATFGFDGQASALGEEAQTVEANVETGVTFTSVNETVTAKEVVNLRTTMDQSSQSNVDCQLKNGEQATRTGIGENGWSRVSYQGKTLYAVSSYLTTDLSVNTFAVSEENEIVQQDTSKNIQDTSTTTEKFKTKFTAVDEYVTAKEVTNLRDMPSVYDPSVVRYQLHNGEKAHRIGTSTLGWSKLEYNGEIVYAISSYLLVTDAPSS